MEGEGDGMESRLILNLFYFNISFLAIVKYLHKSKQNFGPTNFYLIISTYLKIGRAIFKLEFM